MVQIELIKVLRKKNMTYRQAEIACGIAKTTLQAIAAGERDPRLSTLEQIAAGLHVKITDFIKSDYM